MGVDGEKSGFTAGLAMILLASLGYGLMPALTQRAFEAGASVETVLAGRYILGCPLIWAFMLIRRNRLRFDAGATSLMLLLGVSMFLCNVTTNESYKYLPGFIASILIFAYIVIVAIAEIAMGRERPYRSRTLCLATVAVGLVAVVWVPEGQIRLDTLGILMAFAAALTYAMTVMGMGAKKLSGVPAETVTGYLFIVPAVASALRAAAAGQPLLPADTTQAVFIALLGLWAGCFSPIAFCQGVKMIGASTASIANTTEPVIAYFAGALIMSDRISWNASLGGAIVVVAILALNITERRRRQ
ncbi:MAG: DMT family transporter [Clostridiales Family XIII bacterium]|nr:DMT family transporter [Clostridiales Family XIII bacterium]